MGRNGQSRMRGDRTYAKPALAADELVERLIGQGLVVADRERAIRYVARVGYFRLSPYAIPFRDPTGDRRFDAGTGMPLDMSVAQQSDTELESMMQMVAALGPPNATQLLESLCGHRNHTIRWKAIQLLARRDRDAAIERLHHATGDPHPEIRHAATTTLARLEGEPA